MEESVPWAVSDCYIKYFIAAKTVSISLNVLCWTAGVEVGGFGLQVSNKIKQCEVIGSGSIYWAFIIKK